jgi:hypothetical protein
MTSESTRFLGHPKDTNPIFMGTSQCNILAVRGRFLVGGVLLTLGLAAPAAAQDGVPPLERIINVQMRVPAVPGDCTVASAMFFLARQFELVAGIEYPRAKCAWSADRASRGEPIDLYGLTIEQAFARLVALDPRYRILEHDGVFVLRSVQAWGDPQNMLNFKSGSFAVEDATLGIALDTLVSAITGEAPPSEDRFGSRTEQSARRFSIKTGVTSAGSALDAIVRAHGAAIWIVREGTIGRVISVFTFDGDGFGRSRPEFQ